MVTYKVKVGWDVALVSLDVIVPQPSGAAVAIQATTRTYGADNSVYEDGLYVEFPFKLVKSAAAYLALLTQFGVQSSLDSPVTVYVRDSTFAWVRRNGVAVRPEMGREVRWTNFFPRDIIILVKDLKTAA
jgi:hypothetical protein